MPNSVEILSGSKKSAAEVLYPELKSKKVGLGLPAVQPNQILFQNSLKKADVVEEIAASRPMPPHPKMEKQKSLVKEMIAAQEYGSQVTRQLAEVSKEAFFQECEKYKNFTHEAIEAFIQHEKDKETTESWSNFRRAVSFIGSSIAFGAGGLALSAGGGPWALILLFAGGANVGNEIMRVTGGWEKIASFFTSDAQKAHTIANGLQTATAASSALASIIAGFGVTNALQMANAAETASFIANTAGNLAGGVASIAEGHSKSNTLKAEDKHLQQQARASAHRVAVYERTNDLKEIAKRDERAISASSDLVELEQEKIEIIQNAAIPAA